MRTLRPRYPENFDRLPARCGNYRRYAGIRAPKCCGGPGCKGCWDKFITAYENAVWLKKQFGG